MEPKDVKYIAIHCSATQATSDIGVKEIDEWHRARGFRKIGYHFVIRRNGKVETGRALNEIGAHVQGYNSCSVGVCVVGGITKNGSPENNFTPEQMAALAKLVIELKAKFPGAIVQGHSDFPKVNKACPCFDAKQWWANVNKEAC